MISKLLLSPSLRVNGPLWAVCLLLSLLASLFGRPDIPIDETRYVSVAWEMWQGGDFLVPHNNGNPYHHKPPLLFWLINAGWAVFGVNGWWPRAVSALCSFLALVLLVLVARRLWPQERQLGVRAGWVLLGSAFWVFFSTSVIFDVMLTACALLALLGALVALEGNRLKGWSVFGLGLGLGVLAKGPVILLHTLPVLLAAPWWGRAEQGWRAWYKGLGGGVLLGVLIALAWAVPAAYYGGEEFRQAIFWGQTAGRVAGSLAHVKPIYWYLMILPVLLFPWIFWWGAWRAMGQAVHYRRDSGVRFCLAWVLPAFVVFSLSTGKQMHYLLPLLAPLALLLAYGSGHAVRTRHLSRVPLALVLALLGGAMVSAHIWAQRFWFGADVDGGWLVAGICFLLASLALFIRVPERTRLPLFSMGSQALVLALLVFFFPSLWSRFDVTPMAHYIKALQDEGLTVAHASAYNDQYQFYGRLQKPLVEIQRGQEAEWLSRNPNGYVVAYLKQAADLQRVAPVFFQPYFGRAVVLLDQESVLRLHGHQADVTESEGQ